MQGFGLWLTGGVGLWVGLRWSWAQTSTAAPTSLEIARSEVLTLNLLNERVLVSSSYFRNSLT